MSLKSQVYMTIIWKYNGDIFYMTSNILLDTQDMSNILKHKFHYDEHPYI